MPKQLTWFDLSKLDNGTRVVFVEPHDIFDVCVVPAGTVATVTENTLNEMSCALHLLPDNEDLRMALDDWQNCIVLYGEDAGVNPDIEPRDISVGEWHQPSPLALNVLTFEEFRESGERVDDRLYV